METPTRQIAAWLYRLAEFLEAEKLKISALGLEDADGEYTNRGRLEADIAELRAAASDLYSKKTVI